jgi:hypothetical protein
MGYCLSILLRYLFYLLFLLLLYKGAAFLLFWRLLIQKFLHLIMLNFLLKWVRLLSQICELIPHSLDLFTEILSLLCQLLSLSYHLSLGINCFPSLLDMSLCKFNFISECCYFVFHFFLFLKFFFSLLIVFINQRCILFFLGDWLLLHFCLSFL